ncbi:MAG: hypothetical protein AAF492_04010, partial [Verrucomicrobiota bacterium]
MDALYPAGARAGTEIKVTGVGGFNPWPVEAWTPADGVEFKAEKDKGVFTVSIRPDVAPGAIPVRLFNEEGASVLKSFMVGGWEELEEKEPNNTVKDAQPIKLLPVVINGRLEKRGDSDFFKVRLKQGRKLFGWVDAYGLGAPIDCFLHVYDDRGLEVALASESHNPDPRLMFPVERDGDYVLQVVAIDHPPSTSVSFTGSPKAVYRLSLSTQAPPAPSLPDAAPEGDLSVALKPPVAIRGRLGRPGETDRFLLDVAKGASWDIRVEAHRYQLPMDPVMSVFRPNGSLVREVDDVRPSPDPWATDSDALQPGYPTTRLWPRRV